MRIPRFPLTLALLISSAACQTPTATLPNTSTTTSTDAVTVVAQTIAAFSPVPVTQVQLSGTAKAYAGSLQPSGTFSATLKSTGESTLQLNLDKLSRTETTGASSAAPQCQWIGEDGVKRDAALHNCMLPLHWLVPVLELQTQAANLNQSVSATTDEGVAVQTLSLIIPPANPSASAQKIAQLSRTKLLLDAGTTRPTSMSFNIHPDSDGSTDIPIVVRYSDYRQVNGANLPFHIQKYLNNGLVLDLQVETAAVQQ